MCCLSVLWDKYKCLARSKSEKILTIFKLYFSHPFCKKGLGLPAENTRDRLQRWRRTYRSSLLIVQCYVEMSSKCLLRRTGREELNRFAVSLAFPLYTSISHRSCTICSKSIYGELWTMMSILSQSSILSNIQCTVSSNEVNVLRNFVTVLEYYFWEVIVTK
jgi:hypothetical protein